MPAAPSASTESQLTAWVARSPAYAATMRRIRPATVRTSSGIAIRKEDASVINVPPLQHRDGPMVRLPSPAPFSNGRPLQACLVQCARRWRPHPDSWAQGHFRDTDRKSGVSGKSVSVGLDLGGGRSIKKKK